MNGVMDRKLWLLWGLTALAVVANASLGRWNVRRLAEDEALLVHTREVKETIETVTRLTVDSQSAMRGYLLTSDPVFLQPHRNAEQQLPAVLNRLLEFTIDNPAQYERAKRLQELVVAKLAANNQVIATAKTDLPAAVQGIREGGRRRMDAVRAAAKAIGDEEAALFQQRGSRAAEFRDTTMFSLLVGASLALAIGSVGLALTQRQFVRRAAAERRIAESEARFRTLAEAVPQMVWVTQPDGYHEYYNRRWYDYTGLNESQSLGFGWSGPLHPDDKSRAEEHWKKCTESGSDYEIEYRFRGRDGEYRWFLGSARPHRDEHGNIGKWFGTCTDIHDQKRLAEVLEEQVRERTAALREQQQFVDAILQNVTDGIVACDERGELKLFNAASREFHGLPVRPIPPTEWAGYYDLYDADGETPLKAEEVPLARALAGERVRDAEMVIRPAGKPAKFLLANGQPLIDADGKKLGAVVSMQDITERRTAELKLRAYAEALQASNRELEQFASVASHDLQEPLRKIQAFGDRLKTKYYSALDDGGKDYIERMLTSAGRMRRLIDDLLAFSRVSVKPRQPQWVDLNAVARDVLNDLEERIVQTGGRVDVGPLPVLPADPTHMRQLLQNLIGNGLKFARPGVPPVVTVASETTPTGHRLTVADNGIGFEDQYRDRLFQVFQRLHGRNEYEGTGVGLAICRKICERMGGTITASGTPGVGAVFTADLPAAPSGDPRLTPKL
jgi:PAS domain S-box-containing protein